MTIDFQCQHCQTPVQVPISAAGKKGRCPQCHTIVTIPSVPHSQQTSETSSPQTPKASDTAPSEQESPARISDSPLPSHDSKTIDRSAVIAFPCVECGKVLRVSGVSAGKKARCPSCSTLLVTPTHEEAVKLLALAAKKAPKPAPVVKEEELLSGIDIVPVMGPEVAPETANAPHVDPVPIPDLNLPELTPVIGGDYGIGDTRTLRVSSVTLATPRKGFFERLFGEAPKESGSAVTPPSYAVRLRSFSPIAWEREPSLSSLFETAWSVLLQPVETFERMSPDRDLHYASGFSVASTMIGIGVIPLYVSLFAIGMSALASAGIRDSEIFASGFVAGLGFFLTLVGVFLLIGLVSAIVLNSLVGLLVHGALVLVGGAQNGTAATMKVTWYVCGACSLLNLIPIVGGVFLLLWLPLTMARALCAMHRIDIGRALVAVTLPLAPIAIFLALIGFSLVSLIWNGSTRTSRSMDNRMFCADRIVRAI